jgi:hypothetical protein
MHVIYMGCVCVSCSLDERNERFFSWDDLLTGAKSCVSSTRRHRQQLRAAMMEVFEYLSGEDCVLGQSAAALEAVSSPSASASTTHSSAPMGGSGSDADGEVEPPMNALTLVNRLYESGVIRAGCGVVGHLRAMTDQGIKPRSYEELVTALRAMRALAATHVPLSGVFEAEEAKDSGGTKAITHFERQAKEHEEEATSTSSVFLTETQ